MSAKKALSRKRAKPFQATRDHHSLEAAEDYTELILDLVEERGEARTGDIAERLGVSHVTALRTIQRLQREGFVKTEQRKPVSLTAKGKKLALFARDRHQVLVDFFIHIGVPKAVAEVDVEGAEHHISKTTYNKILQYMKKAK